MFPTMQDLLDSVCDFNNQFIKSEEEQRRLDKIIGAMRIVDRKFFIHEESVYIDSAMGIGAGQTISQPSTVARMLFILNLRKGQNVLEVGTGSGWNASLISYLVYPGKIRSIERIGSLEYLARENIQKLKSSFTKEAKTDAERLSNLEIERASIFDKTEQENKYDRIIITAGIDYHEGNKIEEIAGKMLKDKGILICPYREGPLIIYRKNGKLRKEETNEFYVFVSLVGDN